MYQVDDLDEIVQLGGVPRSDAGAPHPVVLAEEGRLKVAYYAAWEDASEVAIAVLTFEEPHAHSFGPPNDETFHGHPLAARGLAPYGAYQVLNSSWIRQLAQMNTVHDRHNPSRYKGLSHFVLSFHDSTFECVARGVESELLPPGEALRLGTTLTL